MPLLANTSKLSASQVRQGCDIFTVLWHYHGTTCCRASNEMRDNKAKLYRWSRLPCLFGCPVTSWLYIGCTVSLLCLLRMCLSVCLCVFTERENKLFIYHGLPRCVTKDQTDYSTMLVFLWYLFKMLVSCCWMLGWNKFEHSDLDLAPL